MNTPTPVNKMSGRRMLNYNTVQLLQSAIFSLACASNAQGHCRIHCKPFYGDGLTTGDTVTEFAFIQAAQCGGNLLQPDFTTPALFL
jgi:hypothetical protein